MRKTASMLGMAAIGGVALYGLYSYLQRKKQKQTNDIISDIVRKFNVLQVVCMSASMHNSYCNCYKLLLILSDELIIIIHNSNVNL